MRIYHRKTERGKTPPDVMIRAVKEVQDTKAPVREIAKTYGIPHVTLRRYVIKAAKKELDTDAVGYRNNRKVFTQDEEEQLAEYLKKAAAMYCGLCPKEVRKLACEFAVGLQKKVPEPWMKNDMAGSDWFTAFIKRRKDITIRTPEATSLGRATSFNKHNVSTFFDKLRSIYERENLAPGKIWNLDETGCTTVQKPNKVIASTGMKQVGSLVSGERGTLVTLLCAISATGNSVPPMFVFPRVHFKDHFLNGSPMGSIGVAHPSGWMTAVNFNVFMTHFVKNVGCSKENKVLLLLDNHESHVSLECINFARENGVIMLSFPPHCSHKLQPLDRSVYFPFKKFYNSACDQWMLENKGKTMTIYDIPVMVGKAFPKAMTPTNIQAGFRVSGICPFNPDIFDEADFLPSNVTDRPLENDAAQEPRETNAQPPVPSGSDAPIDDSTTGNPAHSAIEQAPDEGTPTAEMQMQGSNETPTVAPPPAVVPHVITPEHIRPFKKAAARKKTGGRKPARTRILTDTPEKNELELNLQKRKKPPPKKKGPQRKTKRKEIPKEKEDESDSNDDGHEIQLCDTSDDDLEDNQEDPDLSDVTINSFVLVKYASGDGHVDHYYAGQVVALPNETQVKTKFLRCNTKGNATFRFPEKEDIATHDKDEIVLILPTPVATGGTSRCANCLKFLIDLSCYKLQ